jgi:magnesium-transporting ATPase (P-type)
MAGSWIGDPMEGALVAFAGREGRPRRRPRGCSFPRSTRFPSIPATASWRRCTDHAGAFACVKGAPERLLAMCAWHAGRRRHAARHRRMAPAGETLAASGLRVIAVAEQACRRAPRR